MLIKVRNVKKEFKNDEVVTKVLHGLSFDIEVGEFISIMGPSGSGKSTLMHILGLLDRVSSGEYFLDDVNVANLDDVRLASFRNKKIGFVFQSFNLLNKVNILENVKLPLTYSDEKIDQDKRAKEVLESVELGHRLYHFPNQISGGEKQRVAIARALVNKPSVIFADEPTGNLDSKSGIQVMKILQTLNRAGNTIILVTHETQTAEHADRIIKIIDGEIVDDYKVKNKRDAYIDRDLK